MQWMVSRDILAAASGAMAGGDMPQGWSSQSSDDPDDFDAWLVRRNAHLALRTEADAVARNLWNQSIQNERSWFAADA
jgi:hypothetical protein